MRPFIILSFVFALLVATTFAPFATAAPLPQAAIEARCPKMFCRIESTPTDSASAGSSSTTQTFSGESAMVDLLDGLLLVLSSMRQLAQAAAAPPSQASVDATTSPTSVAPTSTSTVVVDLASIATFTPETPAPTAS
ncbi:hypothetical protein PENSPDRAFT_755709 [Peniophora sp. CONT]|nr:hypothetical protein PENSPDRAFT_755709 [Peniophora sp. CONT]